MAVDPVDGARTGEEILGDESDESAKRDIPPDIPDGDGDDIVARQLREAAMKEKDPALSERLWQEYRDYTSGSRPKQKEGSGG
ncbi:MAG: hypothetical protein O7A98_07910 [Acidobacteria bacterium]|nr:hypothetical protein [Acidobacteriota bacterium]